MAAVIHVKVARQSNGGRGLKPAGWVCALLRDQERIEGQFVVFTRDSIRFRPLLQVVGVLRAGRP